MFRVQSRDIIFDGCLVFTIIDRSKPGPGYKLDGEESTSTVLVYKKNGFANKLFFRNITLKEAFQAAENNIRKLCIDQLSYL